MLTFCRLGYAKVWDGNPGIFEERHGDMLVYGQLPLLADRHTGWRQHLADLNYCILISNKQLGSRSPILSNVQSLLT